MVDHRPTGPRGHQIAAYDTRAPKDTAVDPDALRPSWDQRLDGVAFNRHAADRCYDRQPGPAVVSDDDRREEALHAAAWDETGHVTLTLSEDNTGDDRAQGHGVAADAFEEAEPFPGRTARTESVEVLAVALDDVIPVDLNIDVVKVDIQGADHIAIRGMERTLVNSHPTVLVEFWPEGIRELGDEPVDVLQYYARLGYDIRLLGEPAHTGKLALGAIVENAFTNEHRYATLVLTPKTP